MVPGFCSRCSCRGFITCCCCGDVGNARHAPGSTLLPGRETAGHIRAFSVLRPVFGKWQEIEVMLAEARRMPAVLSLVCGFKLLCAIYFKRHNSAAELFCTAWSLVVPLNSYVKVRQVAAWFSVTSKVLFRRKKNNVEGHKIQNFPF